MGDVATPATIRTLVEELGDPDYRKRDVAASSLRKIPEARNVLLKDLAACEDPSKAWSIAELLPSFEGKWRQDTLDALWKRLQQAIDDEERIQTAFLHVLKSADVELVYDRLAEQGVKLVKAKKYKEALGFLTAAQRFSRVQSRAPASVGPGAVETACAHAGDQSPASSRGALDRSLSRLRLSGF